MSRYYTLLFVVLLNIGQSFAQAPMGLEDYIKIAVENNLGIKISKNKQKISEKAVTRGNAGMLPTLDLNAYQGASVVNSTATFRTGEELQANGINANRANISLDFNYTVFDGMAMFRTYDKLKSQSELTQLIEHEKLESIVLQVMATYFDIVRLGRQLDLNRESIRLSKDRLDEVTQKISLGAATSLDKLYAQSNLAQDSSAFIQSQIAYDEANMDFRNYLGVNHNMQYMVSQRIEVTPKEVMDTIINGDLEHNVLVQQNRVNKTISELDYDIYQASKYPRVYINGSYTFSNSNNEASFTSQNRANTFSYGIGLTYNLFDGFKKRTQIERAKYEIENRDLEKKELELRLRKDVAVAQRAYERYFDQYELEKRNIALFEKVYKQMKEMYRLGKITPLEFRDSQIQLMQAKSRMLESQIQIKLNEIELLRLHGKLVR